MATGNTTVLIVEDEADTEGQGVKSLLTQAGFDVVGIAETAEEAVKMAKQFRPLVVVMDIMFPGDQRGGITAARRIREEVGSQIVYLTGARPENDLSEAAWKVRPFAYLEKPVGPQVATTVRQACLQAKKRADVFICYSHEDVKMLDELMRYLGPLQRLGVDVWVDRRIAPATPWKSEIQEALLAARVAIVLVSQSLANSAFITEVELPTLLRCHTRGDIALLLVYLEHVPGVFLSDLGINGIQAINGPDDPLDTDKWPPARRKREVWGRISEIIVKTLDVPAEKKPETHP